MRKFSVLFLTALLFSAFSSGAEALDVRKGLTISAAVKLNKLNADFGSGFDKDKNIIYHHDIIASKGRDFVFGRRADMWVDQLYFNFFNEGKWAVPLARSVSTPKHGKWAVWCVTAQPFNIREEGRSGTIVTTYLNGEMENRVEIPVLMNNSDAPVKRLQGMGIKGDNWGFNGEVADLLIVDRVLSEQEIIEHARKSGLVKIAADTRHPIPEKMQVLANKLQNSAVPEIKWAADCMVRFAENCGVSDAAFRALKTLVKFKKSASVKEFAVEWNRFNGKEFTIVNTGSMLVMLGSGANRCGHPLLGILDLNGKREVLGGTLPGWEIAAVNAKKGKVKLASVNTPFKVRRLTPETDTARFRAVWQISAQTAVHSDISIKGKRITANISVANKDANLLLEEIQYPKFTFARKSSGLDYLVHPLQSGVLYPNPVAGEVPSPWHYPTGWLNMQFGSYYDKVSGVYWSPEDPQGNYWFYSVKSRNMALEVTWSHAIGYAPGQKGGNQLPASGAAAIELFDGDWYDAAMCYKRFVAQKARWWVKELPRKSTPAWYRDNVMNLSHWTFNDAAMKKMPEEMKAWRDYLELPFTIHWYRWNKRGGMPDYYPKDGSLKTLAALQRADIRVKPYFDNRLWSELDPPDFKGHKIFDAYGRRFAVKNRDGSMNYERYHKECREVVMCPGCVRWQKHLSRIVGRLASYEFDAIYHDQVAASRPFLCYDTGHGHLLNCHKVWGDGYRNMFKYIAELRKRHPALAHETEDAADAHLQNFDGFLPWRWTNNRQVPLFAAVYAGRVQFVGRTYTQTSKGDRESLFVKAAVQLVNGEQIGWMVISNLRSNVEFARFVKQLAHTRKLLLPYFNGGSMQKPLKFASPVKKSLWGTSSKKPSAVQLPQVLNSVWNAPGLGKIVLLVNTGTSAVNVEFPWASRTEKLALAPRQIAVVCENTNSPEAARIADGLAKISRFTLWDAAANQLPKRVVFKNGVARILHNGVMTLPPSAKFQCRKMSMPVIHSGRFSIKGEICKTPEMSSKKSDNSITVGFYDAAKKFKALGVMAANIPVDGKWHRFEGEITTPAAGMKRLEIYFYNSRSTGKVQIRNMVLTQK